MLSWCPEDPKGTEALITSARALSFPKETKLCSYRKEESCFTPL